MHWGTQQCHFLGNHRVKTVCENDKLRLQCRPKSILAIYSASYGRFLRGKPECDALNTGGPHIGMPEWFETETGQEPCREYGTSPALDCTCVLWPLLAGAQQGGAGSSAHRSMPHVSAECVAPDALRRVSKKCHRKGNCTVAADKATFGDPCLPGTKKQLRVSYTCGESSPGARGTRATGGVCAVPSPCQRQRLQGRSRVMMLGVCSPCSAQAAAGGGGP